MVPTNVITISGFHCTERMLLLRYSTTTGLLVNPTVQSVTTDSAMRLAWLSSMTASASGTTRLAAPGASSSARTCPCPTSTSSGTPTPTSTSPKQSFYPLQDPSLTYYFCTTPLSIPWWSKPYSDNFSNIATTTTTTKLP